jgi:hypothetical protein
VPVVAVAVTPAYPTPTGLCRIISVHSIPSDRRHTIIY